MSVDGTLKVKKIDTSSVDPGESGASDRITIRVTFESTLYPPGVKQSISVLILLESGSIRKGYDAAVLDARKRTAQVFDVLAQTLQS